VQSHSGQQQRWIIHVDMDAFYASVEQRDKPALRGLPVIVGGIGARGVVAAASYEARQFGVFSAMPVSRAKKLCPNGIYVRPRMAEYQRASKIVFEIFQQVTPLVEPLSLDEAFLDVSGSIKLLGGPEQIGRLIKQKIKEQTSLVASVGIAYNKFLAKLASDHNKPDGFLMLKAGHIRQFLDPLPVQRIWGIGRQTLKKLHAHQIQTIADLRQAEQSLLSNLLGNQAEHYLALANGQDNRKVVPDRPEKSISAETTFDTDLESLKSCKQSLLGLSGRVGLRLRKKKLQGRSLQIKIRTPDFQTYTRSVTFDNGVDQDKLIYQHASRLLEIWWFERRASVRLLGVGLGQLCTEQADLFDSPDTEINQVSDQIRQRFGNESLSPARLINPKEETDHD